MHAVNTDESFKVRYKNILIGCNDFYMFELGARDKLFAVKFTITQF